MKNNIKYVLTIFLAIALTDLHAQVVPKYIFGLNLSSIELKNKGINTKTETPMGIHFGGYFEVPLKDNFSLEPGILFSAKGSNFKLDSVELSLAPIYIEVPVLAVYSFGSDAIKISLFAGPYFAFGVGGYKIESGVMRNMSFGSGENNDLKPFDIGFNFGTGINIKGLLIYAQYGIGLSNIAPVTLSDIEMKNRVIGISISSSFAYNY
jgi:hypothetical protein